MIILTLKEPLPVPLEAETLTPDRLHALREAEIRALPVFLGKRQGRVDDFFTVAGEASDHLQVRGDCGRAKWIGRGMTRGRIDVVGNAGMHLGAYMQGGEIHVSGNATDWVGGEMAGGLIHVRGSAGGQLGAAYRGSLTGMRGGAILVEGSAGLEIGMRMKRGLIAVRGKVRDFAGLQMKGGTIVLLSGAEIRTGAWMARGTIVSLAPLRLLPTFAFACDYRPTFLRLLAQQLGPHGFDLPDDMHGSYRRFSGDTSIPGKGEILCWRPEAA
jgi:formylmethanofuran dehydrogenase subunit C